MALADYAAPNRSTPIPNPGQDANPYKPLGKGTYEGYEGVQKFWSRWRNAVGQLKFAPEEVIDAGDHVVVIAQVFSFDDEDKCVRVQEFYDRGAALEAAGME